MTYDQKEILRVLLQGGFLRSTMTHNRVVIFGLYDARVNRIRNCRVRTFKTIEKHADLQLTVNGKEVTFPAFKKDKDNKITLNLATVRRLHGKTWLKQTYKYYQKKNKLESLKK